MHLFPENFLLILTYSVKCSGWGLFSAVNKYILDVSEYAPTFTYIDISMGWTHMKSIAVTTQPERSVSDIHISTNPPLFPRSPSSFLLQPNKEFKTGRSSGIIY